ncbi:hypothetical protein OAU44_00045 [bacterium]|nr:hypothetical protein [bacterium]
MRKVVTLSGFKIDVGGVNPEEKILKYVMKNKYIIPKIAEIEAGLAASTASATLRRLSESGKIKDMGSTSITLPNKVKHRCHLYTVP